MISARERLLDLSGQVREVGGRRLVYKPLPTGHLRTRFGACSYTRGLKVGAGDVSVEASAPPIFDQGQTGSCEGHMHARCVTTAFAAAGRPLGFVVSPAELYRNGRAVDRVPHPDGRFDALVDEGAFTSSVTRAMQTYGVRPIGPMATDGRFSDADPATINDEPTLADVEVERRKVPLGERAIVDCSTGRDVAAVIEDIRTAIGAGYPVGFGAFVDTRFMNWTPAAGPMGACNVNDPNGGGHAISILEALSDGTLWVDNSWSESWGAAGRILVGPAFVQQITDITVFVPELA